MKIPRSYILFLFLIMLSLNSGAQFNPNGICRIENGRIIFKLDLRWTDKEKKETSKLFNLDSTLLNKAFEGLSRITKDSIIWDIKKISHFQVEISRPLSDKKATHININDIFLLDENLIQTASATERESVPYGVNNFTLNTAFHYENGIAIFYLPGYKNAKKVYLPGSFNNWSTIEMPMQHNDSGWIIKVKLLQGKYSYKYLIDGRWITDPNNKHDEDDGMGNTNSFVFCYNYKFELKGYTNEKKVLVAGNFNKWNKNELQMKRTSHGWELPIYLREGTISYKFIVGDVWITDPANKATHSNGSGNFNSYLGIGDSHTFILKGFKAARKVVLAGNFNGWNADELVMNKTADGWELPYILAPGNYEYKFIVDGKWMTDPANPYTTGSGDYTNSYLTFKPNHTFSLSNFGNAKAVIITGSFNDWSPDGYRMQKKEGKWILPITLQPGKYTYKFIVDGKWILDPDNKLWEQNEYGTGNSILWIKP